MNELQVACIVGCRPNFIKAAPIMAALARRPGIDAVLVHTGQHYSSGLSDVFFDELDIPRPDVSLNVESGSQARQTASILVALEETFMARPPDLVMVIGDVNSTVAAALAAIKLGIPVAHVEAGLRSFDREMPEEINRVLTDAISDLLFVTERSGIDNLVGEGRSRDAIFFVGNVLIDTLEAQRDKIEASPIVEELSLRRREYALVTAHRPANVDDPQRLDELVGVLDELQRRLPVVFPVHLRTERKARQWGLWSRLESLPGVRLVEPLGYLPFVRLMRDARLVLTDSGGVQEETTALGVPCLTLRDNTERPVTVEEGTNRLVGCERRGVVDAALGVLETGGKRGRRPDRWDGHAADRIVDVLWERRERIRQLYPGLRPRRRQLAAEAVAR